MVPDLRGKHVALVGLGPSSTHYLGVTEVAGDRHRAFDQTWTINSYGAVIAHDVLMFMDDVRMIMREIEDPKMVGVLEMLKKHPGPVYTCQTHPDFPALVEYPLEEVVNSAGWDYLNNGAAYALALMLAGNVAQISCFGIDFFPMDSHDAPAGRECCEYWIGRAHQKGINIMVSHRSTLLDANKRDRKGFMPLYGYSTVDMERGMVTKSINGVDRPWMTIKMTPRPETSWPPVPPSPKPFVESVPA